MTNFKLSLASLTVLSLCAALSGCGTLKNGVLDNVLTSTLPSSKAPARAFLNSTYFGLSFGAELRQEDADALAELIRSRVEYEMLLRLLSQQQPAQPQPKASGT